MQRPTDQELISRTRAGDRDAYGALVRRHEERIFRVVFHIVKNENDAEEVTQEVFVRAFRALDRFDGRSEPFTWLYRIAVNLSLNCLRSARRRPLDRADDGRLEGLPGVGPDPRVAMQHRELYAALAEGIDGLSETLRTTLILVCIDGLAHDQAAAILGIPEGTVAWRVHEARRKLREFLDTRGFEGVAP